MHLPYIRRCLLRFLILLSCLCKYHCNLQFISACLHIMINHSRICAKFVNLSYIFGGATCFVFYGTNSALLALAIVFPSSHNIVASLCYWNVDCFIHVVVILRYDCKFAPNTIVRKLSMVGTCEPWANF
jgi:hypothetical protein